MRTENKGKERVYAIRRKIAENRGLNDFPKPEDFSITEDEVDDFLYEMMGGPQSIEEQKKIYTKYGICFILPIGIVALMKQSMANFLIGVASGLILCAIYYLIHKFIRQRKLNKLLQSGVKEYIDAVERY
ncbi:MAG: hypothetical protein J5918_09290 [Prevotella sp.]|nr:hypothetical protein [Prevotella sp.]